MRKATALLATAVLLAGLTMVATPAQAHNYLVSSTPEADATLTELPDEFTITTNDVLLDLGGAGNAFVLEVRDQSGLFYGDGCVMVDGSSMTSEAALGEAGEYTVLWQVVSTDGHPVSDEFSFTWAPTGVSEPSVGADAAPVCGAEAPPADDAVDDPTPAADAPSSGQTDPVSEATPASTDGWWIGGAAVTLVLVVGVAGALSRRRKAE